MTPIVNVRFQLGAVCFEDGFCVNEKGGDEWVYPLGNSHGHCCVLV